MRPKPYPAPMVGWFDPGQLLSTGIKAVVSGIMGLHSDRRLVQALAHLERTFYDYSVHYRDESDGGPVPDPSRPRTSLWLDFVADTGDGWNSTYAVAYHLAQPRLVVGDAGSGHPTERGSVLVFGGDEVYPTPSHQAYEERLVAPYSAALGGVEPGQSPHVFAIPGNHDWYDSLVAFSRLFCSPVGGRHFGRWRTRQTRSYFALKLPAGWWLFGVDGQLQADIDAGQIAYFRSIAEGSMEEGDRVILCLANPSWIYAQKYRDHGGYDESDLLYLLNHVLRPRGVEVKVFLSGDLHHYRRHEEEGPEEGEAPVQKITAGGGGAFLHPTHGDRVKRLHEQRERDSDPPRTFALCCSYPAVARSKRLVWRNLFFAWWNPRFGVVPASLYLLAAWAIGAATHWQPPTSLFDPLYETVRAFRDHPGLFVVFASTLAAFVFFTDTHSRPYKWAGGVSHALAHYGALFYIGWGAAFVAGKALPMSPLLQMPVAAALVFGLGWGVGSFIVGSYLLISSRLWGRHGEQAFSALRIEDYKNFLRLHIREDGTLTIYPIGLDRVPRRWRARREAERGATPSTQVPDDPAATVPRLIEPPIVIRPRAVSRF